MCFNRKIILEDGQEYCGYAFGGDGERVCELVFNTSMTGYQEILSDPSYTDQAVVMTYPLIGNYGMAQEDYETDAPSVSALLVRSYTAQPSGFRCAATLAEVMEKYGIPGIYGIDTRKLTRSIRDYGSRKALITDCTVSKEEGLRRLRETALPTDAVQRVSCKEKTVFSSGEERFHVVAIDCGMKKNIVRSLNRRGCRVTAVPWNTSAEEIRGLQPDGILLSNGPGDPADLPGTIAVIKALLGQYPIFGICLGHQLLAIAYGAATYKLPFGHRGGNHPVQALQTKKIEMTAQNHSYAVDAASLAKTALVATHVNLLDGTIEGLACEKDRAFGVQFHPESAPGPRDSACLFDRFADIMKENLHA